MAMRTDLPRPPVAVWPVAAFLLAFFIVPAAYLTWVSVGGGLNADQGLTVANYQRFFASSYFLEQLGASLWLSTTVTVVTLILGFPVAYYMTTCSKTTRRVLLIALLSPLLVSVVVRALGWLVVLGHNGLVNSVLMELQVIEQPLSLTNRYFTVVVGFVHVLLPFMILPIAAVLEKIDPSILEASSSLGARPKDRFLRVTLPLSLPGIGAGSVIVFALTMGAYATPLILGGGRVNNLALQIYRDTKLMAPNYPFAGAMSVVLVATSLFLIVYYLTQVEGKMWERDR